MNRYVRLELTSLPGELQQLLALLCSDAGQEEAIEDIRWELFLRYAQHHRLIPPLYSVLHSREDGVVPEEVKRAIKQEYQRNTFRMLGLAAEMEKVCRILGEAGVRTLVLKGPILGHELYGDLSLRTSGDLDLLVPLQDLERAASALAAEGYRQDEEMEDMLGDWKWRHHHLNFSHPGHRTQIELHWRLSPGPSREPGFEPLWQRRKEVFLTESAVYRLGNEDLFLFLASHGARHGWSRLRWLLDIDRCMNLPIDWQALRHLSKQQGLSHVVDQALILSSQLLGTPLPESVKGRLGFRAQQLAQQTMFYLERMIHLHTPPLPEDVARYHRKYRFALLSFPLKCVYILSFLYPYPTDRDILPLPKSLHFLYFPLRPFLLIWKWTKRAVAGGTL